MTKKGGTVPAIETVPEAKIKTVAIAIENRRESAETETGTEGHLTDTAEIVAEIEEEITTVKKIKPGGRIAVEIGAEKVDTVANTEAKNERAEEIAKSTEMRNADHPNVSLSCVVSALCETSSCMRVVMFYICTFLRHAYM